MKERLYEIAHSILRLSDADATEVIVFFVDDLLTRYANSFITQNSREKAFSVSVRLRYGNRAGVASTDDISRESLAALVKNAKEIAMNSPKDPDLPDVPSTKSVEYYPPSYDETLYDPDPERAARIIRRVIEIGKPFRAFGNVTQGNIHYMYLTSEGFEGYHRASMAGISINYMDDTFRQSGWAQRTSYRMKDIEETFEEAAEISRNKALLNRDPAELKPGRYTVIIESLGIYEILHMMGWFGFSGKSYYEGTSFLRNKLGQKVFSDKLTIEDRPSDIELFTSPFDFEGTQKRDIKLVENGVFKIPALDKRFAKKLNMESTGHAVIPFYPLPFPNHMSIKPGDKSLKEMIEETDYGILITRLWYVNVVDPSTFTLTGLTRDGTFLIENGRISKAIRNMRFTQNIQEAFNRIVSLENVSHVVTESNYYSFFPSATKVPAIKIEDFTFSSVSKF